MGNIALKKDNLKIDVFVQMYSDKKQCVVKVTKIMVLQISRCLSVGIFNFLINYFSVNRSKRLLFVLTICFYMLK